MRRQTHQRKGKNGKAGRVSLRLWPLILLFAVYPLVFAGLEVNSYLADYPWFPGGETQYDFFLYAKSMVFLALVVIMLIGLIDSALLGRRPVFAWKKFWPLYGYSALVILSTICSVNRSLSVRGMWEQYETVWVLLGYVITVLYAADEVRCEQDTYLLGWALSIGAGLQGLIGAGQLLGNNILETIPGRWLLGLGIDRQVADNLIFRFGEGERNRVYMTLYNPNYAGVYMVMLLPVVCGLFLQVKKISQRIILGMTIGLLFIALLGSGSRTGMIVLTAICLLAVLFVLKGRRRWIAAALAGIAALLLIVGYDLWSGGSLGKALQSSVFPQTTYNLSDLHLSNEGIYVTYKGTEMLIAAEDDGAGILPMVTLADSGDQADLVRTEDGLWKLPGESYKNLGISAYEQDGYVYVYVLCDKIPWNFVYEPVMGTWFYVTRYGKMDDIVDARTVLPGWERAFTGRGYIWGRALCMLPGRVLIGSDPDTFVQTFPQNDYRMRANTAPKMLAEVPSKPHSMYLQAALQTGGLSLVMLVIFWVQVLRKQFRRFTEQKKNKSRALYLGIWLGLTAYLLMGIFNDSILAVAPLFWGMAGICVDDKNELQ